MFCHISFGKRSIVIQRSVFRMLDPSVMQGGPGL